MTDDPSWLSSFGTAFGETAGTATSAAGEGLSSGVLQGGEIGAGALQGTTATGISELGSIAPQAAETGALGADLAVGGGLSFSEPNVGSIPLGGGGGAAPAIGGLPLPPAFSPPPGSAAPSVGALGGASASAAPASSPASPTTSGMFSIDSSASGAPLGDPAATPGAVGKLGGAATTPAAGNPTAWDKFKADPGLGTGFDALVANPNVALATLGLGANLALGDRKLPGESQISSMAGRLDQQSQSLQHYLDTGTLPPGVHAGLTSAGAAAKATIRSRHASSGTQGSSAEEQELGAVDSQMATQGANIAMQLFQQGASEAGIAAQLYQTILQGAVAQDQELGTAIGRFASTLTGGPTINLTRAA